MWLIDSRHGDSSADFNLLFPFCRSSLYLDVKRKMQHILYWSNWNVVCLRNDRRSVCGNAQFTVRKMKLPLGVANETSNNKSELFIHTLPEWHLQNKNNKSCMTYRHHNHHQSILFHKRPLVPNRKFRLIFELFFLFIRSVFWTF